MAIVTRLSGISTKGDIGVNFIEQYKLNGSKIGFISKLNTACEVQKIKIEVIAMGYKSKKVYKVVQFDNFSKFAEFYGKGKEGWVNITLSRDNDLKNVRVKVSKDIIYVEYSKMSEVGIMSKLLMNLK